MFYSKKDLAQGFLGFFGLFFLSGLWVKADPARDLASGEALGSFRTLEAILPTLFEVFSSLI